MERKTVNAYVCDNLHITVTKDVDRGVTPMFIGCPECKTLYKKHLMASSRMYRVNQSAPHTHEWYRPASNEGLSQFEIEHVEQGGLLLRKIK